MPEAEIRDLTLLAFNLWLEFFAQLFLQSSLVLRKRDPSWERFDFVFTKPDESFQVFEM